MDDVNIKCTLLNSLLDPLGDETLHMMNLQRITLQQASFGEIYQHMLIALEKLYKAPSRRAETTLWNTSKGSETQLLIAMITMKKERWWRFAWEI